MDLDGSLSLKSRNRSDKFSLDYIDLLHNGKPIEFNLSSFPLNTERGIYSQFVTYHKSMKAPLSEITPLAKEHKENLDTSSYLNMDIVLNMNNQQEAALYAKLEEFRDSLLMGLANIVADSDTCLSKHFAKIRSNHADKFNCIFLKEHSTDPSIKYIRLKIIKNSVSYDKSQNELELLNLCYKSFRTAAKVKIDNIRVPKNINVSTQFSVHLCLVAQIVDECPQTVSYFNDLLQCFN